MLTLDYCVGFFSDSESTVEVIWRRRIGRLIVNDQSGAMAIESVVTYFRTRLGVNGRTKKTTEVVKMHRHTVRIRSGCFQVQNLTCAQLCHPTVFI